MSNTPKVSEAFGERLSRCFDLSVTLRKLGYSYFNTSALISAAKSIDMVVLTAHLEGRKLNALEQLMIEVLVSEAGFGSITEAANSFDKNVVTRKEVL